MPYFDCYCKNNSPNCPRCYPRRHNRRDRHEDRVIYEERRRRYESPSNQSYSPVSRRQRRNVEVKEKKYVKVVPVYRKSRKPPEQIKKPHESTYSKYIKSESTTPSQVNHSYVPQILPGSTRFSQPPVNYYAPMRMPVNIPVEVPMNLVGQPQYVQPPIMQYQPVKVYPNVRARLPVVNQNQNPYVRYVSANQPVYQSNQTMSNRVPLNYTNTGYINNSPSNQRFVQYIHPQSSVRSDQYRQPNLNPYSQQVQYITNNVQPNDERSPSYFRMNQPKSVYPLNQNMYPNQHNQSQYLSGFTYPNLDTNVVGGNVNSQSINMQSNLFDATNSNSNNNNHVMQSVDSYDNLTKFNHGATNSTSRFIDTNLSQNPNVNPNLSQLIVPNVNPNVNSVMNNFQHSNQSVNPNMVSSINSSVNPNMVQNVNPNMNYINRNVSHSMTPNINSFVNSNTVQNMNQITNTAITPNMYRNLNSNFNNNNSSINQRSATNMNQNLNYNKSPTVNPNMNSSRNYNMGVNMNPNINTSFNSNVHQNINSNQNFNEDPNMNYNINSNTNSRMNQNIMNNSNSNTINRYLNMNPNLNANMNVNANQNIMSNPNSNLKQTINYSSTQMNPNMISRNLLAGNMKLQNNESILNNFSHNYQKPTNDYIDTPMDQFNKGTFDNTNTTKINNNAIITSLTKEIQSPNSKYIKTQNNDNSEETESDSSKDSSLDEKLLESLNNLNNFNQDFNSKKMYNLKNVEHQLKDVSSKLSTLKIENDMLIFNKYKDMLNIKNTIATINYNDIILESKESDKCGNSLKWSFNQKM
ncbi:hypothetical protein A3Q56_04893 [Intoshia linei]|uniref:Uncharacterized protein n=1 Tax=Intoshia linei TaxID=1819745 RepID=A0A177B1T3_9BILA|nr:hypothetical protein A3Q56_04893 [Intoshia linei]